MISISVIMPVFNAEDYLARAIESVLNQTFENFELILVDDGSKDNSSSICDEYVDRDKRVRVIHQDNGGICAARNKGLEYANGEYIAFIDNDDVYLPNLLEENYRLAKRYGADVLKYGNQYINQRNLSITNFQTQNPLQEESIIRIDQKNLKELYPKINDEDWLVYVWDGLFRNDFIKKHHIVFDQEFKCGHEDRVFCMQCYQHLHSIVINRQIYYYHIVYKSSASRIFSLSRIADTEKLLIYERNLFDVLGIDKIYPLYWRERVLAYMFLIFSILRKPESKVVLQEIFFLIGDFKTKYYDSENSDSLSCRSTEKRWKNRIYECLFRQNNLRSLAYGLVIDRNVKSFFQIILRK